jgi:hypothetical protein
MFISIILILVLFQIRMAGKRRIGGMAQKKLLVLVDLDETLAAFEEHFLKKYRQALDSCKFNYHKIMTTTAPVGSSVFGRSRRRRIY